MSALKEHSAVDFHFVNGPHSARPPPGYDMYFGAPPYQRFLNYTDGDGADDVARKVREVRAGLSAEDTIRQIRGDGVGITRAALRAVIDDLITMLDEDPEIEVGNRETWSGFLQLTCRRVF